MFTTIVTGDLLTLCLWSCHLPPLDLTGEEGVQGTTPVGVVGSWPGSVGVAASMDDLGAVAEEAEPGPVTPPETDSRLRRTLCLCPLLYLAERF